MSDTLRRNRGGLRTKCPALGWWGEARTLVFGYRQEVGAKAFSLQTVHLMEYLELKCSFLIPKPPPPSS